MTFKLFAEAIIKYISGVVLTGAFIFIPCGTFSYFNGWLLMTILFVPMFFAGIIMMIKNPELLKMRLNAKETQHEQRTVLKLCILVFIIGFVVAGLDYRFQFYVLPQFVVIFATVIFLAAYALYAEVLRENSYLSRTVEVRKNQKVIDTGLYMIVRHPMYSSSLLMFLSMPLVLGSVYSFLIFLAYPFIIAKRIENEEKLLEKNLDGYYEYKERVKYRLLPFIW